MTPLQPAVTIDCFVRASALAEPIDAVIERLRDCETRDVIDELTVEAWPAEIGLTDVPENSIGARYELFETWADRNDVSLGPAFATRERTTLVDGEPDTVLVLPVLCLAVHVDDTLANVVPHRTGTMTYTVEDALADLERDRTRWRTVATGRETVGSHSPATQ